MTHTETHSPVKINLPWTGSGVKASRTRYNYCTIWGRMGVKIADVQGRGRASTEARRDLIIRSVNALPSLVEALEMTRKAFAQLLEPSAIAGVTITTAWATCMEADEKARAALALAKGE